MKCRVHAYLGNNEFEWREAEFMGLFQHSDVFPPSPMIGGHEGGTVAYPVVVRIDGELQQVETSKVRFDENITELTPEKIENAGVAYGAIQKLFYGGIQKGWEGASK